MRLQIGERVLRGRERVVALVVDRDPVGRHAARHEIVAHRGRLVQPRAVDRAADEERRALPPAVAAHAHVEPGGEHGLRRAGLVERVAEDHGDVGRLARHPHPVRDECNGRDDPEAGDDGQQAAQAGKRAPFGVVFQGFRSLRSSGVAACPALDGRVTLAWCAFGCPRNGPMPDSLPESRLETRTCDAGTRYGDRKRVNARAARRRLAGTTRISRPDTS